MLGLVSIMFSYCMRTKMFSLVKYPTARGVGFCEIACEMGLISSMSNLLHEE